MTAMTAGESEFVRILRGRISECRRELATSERANELFLTQVNRSRLCYLLDVASSHGVAVSHSSEPSPAEQKECHGDTVVSS